MCLQILSQSTPIARKEHKCSFCGGKIIIGEKYERLNIKYDYMYTWKSHINTRFSRKLHFKRKPGR
jgi:hypothetical protein